ncbi:hypothetical protein CWI39_1188p0020 [Hamiltosporidium magnivora]|uniref:Integrase catalytic domain-containing protein n=1 Tax=Hamiltosporidium magnivora TaxID=148818 RepID=A0A4Q9L596_9MICR|nr:hypothetical protein CWI39_1188p0020 [Hamiltosporidium magnivora]
MIVMCLYLFITCKKTQFGDKVLIVRWIPGEVITQEVNVFIVARFIVSDTPSILQTENRREFDNNTVKDLSRIRPDLKMVRKKAQDSQSQSYVEGATKEVQNMFYTCLKGLTAENCQKAYVLIRL